MFFFYRNHRSVFDWKRIKYIKIDLRPEIYLFLKEFDVLFPHINCIIFDIGKYSPMFTMFIAFEEEREICLEIILGIVKSKVFDSGTQKFQSSFCTT